MDNSTQTVENLRLSLERLENRIKQERSSQLVEERARSNAFQQHANDIHQAKHIINSLNKLQNLQSGTEKLITPREQLMKSGVSHPEDLGKKIWGKWSDSPVGINAPTGTSIFEKNYVQTNHAIEDKNKAIRATAETNMKGNGQCSLFPPLLIRYYPVDNKDRFVGAIIGSLGSIVATKGKPEVIVNFHSNTHAITLSVCTSSIPPSKMPHLKIAIMSLYKMYTTDHVREGIRSIQEFQLMYDQSRENLLRSMGKIR
jgi:hypothetical protein